MPLLASYNEDAEDLWESLCGLMGACHPDYTILFRQLATVTVRLTDEASDEELLDTLKPWVALSLACPAAQTATSSAPL